jgi:hypothetical protein
MRTRTLRSTLASIAAVSALTLATAGCGGSSDTESGTEAPKSASSTATETSKASPVLTQAQLDKALLTASDVEDYEVDENKASGLRPKTDNDACRPLADIAASGATVRTPQAEHYASRTYSSKQSPGLAVTVGLLSYQGDGAQRTLTEVREAIDACGDGFTTTGTGATAEYTAVTGETPPKGGDESVSWLTKIASKGTEVPMRWTATRSGNSIALFITLHFADPSGVELPTEFHADQIERLEKATDTA